MAYLDTNRRPSAASMVAVVAVHGAMGAALFFGLTVSGVITPPDVPIPTFEVKKVPPPPPPKPVDEPRPDVSASVPYVPTPPLPLPTRGPEIDLTQVFPTPAPPRPLPGPSLTPSPSALPSATPSFTPRAATPRTNPAGWVTTDDYRSNWIRQEMTGKARFRLEIAADGRVMNCTITGSSGHSQLDAATCALVSRRAKFQPARGSEGQPVVGSYSSAIDWQLPD